MMVVMFGGIVLREMQAKPEETAPKLDGNVRRSSGISRHSAAYFLAALLLIFVTAPFIEHLRGGELIEAVLMTVVLISAVLAIGGRRRTLAWAMVLVMPAVVGKWLNHLRPDLMPPEVFLGAGLLFVLFVVLHLLRFIQRAPRVDSEILCVGIANYLMLGWLWAFAYMLVARWVPDSFAFTVAPASTRSLEGFNGLYFSYSTITSVSYGDIIPVWGGARMLAMAEAMAGMFYGALLIARLVTLYYSKN